MALVGAIFIFLILFLNDKSKTVKANKKVAEMDARGEFDPQDYNKFSMLWQDAAYDWEGERKMFPKEYWAYFERNDKARQAYIQGLVGKQEMEAGRKPILSGYYDKHTYNPFGMFNSQYAEKIKIFNETGRMYF